MLLDLTRWRRSGDNSEVLDQRFDASAVKVADDDFRVVAPVVFHAVASRDAGKLKVTLKGRLTTTIEVDCGRCLDPFQVPVNAALDLIFLPASANTGEAEQEVADDELGVSFYEGDTIDLGDVVREQCYLILPMKPLCREDCQGLCPNCGVNHNRETCECQVEWVDPRLEPLKKLRDR